MSSSRPDRIRSASKPNPDRRFAIRVSLWQHSGRECQTCGLLSSWSFNTPNAAPEKINLGHIISERTGGTYVAANVILQCYACNMAAKRANKDDLTPDLLPGATPDKWVPTKVALQMPDPRSVPHVEGLADAEARAAARKARGLTW